MKNIIKKFLLQIVYQLLGFLFIISLVMVTIENYSRSTSSGETLLFSVIIILIYIISFNLQIVVHEFGHLIFGKITGYKFKSLRVRNLMILKLNGKLTFKKYKIAGTAGQCSMIPPECDGYNCPYALYLLGGSLLNLITSIISLYFYFLFSNSEFISNFLLVFSIISFIIGITNIIPNKPKLIANDGYNLRSIKKGKYARYFFYFQLKINALLSSNKKLKDMPEEWFNIPQDADLNNPIIFSMSFFKISYIEEKYGLSEGEKLCEYFLNEVDSIIDIHKYELQSYLLFCKIIKSCPKEEVDKYYTEELKKYIKMTSTYPSKCRLLYAYSLLVEHNEEKSKVELNKFNKSLKYYPYESEIEGELEMIKYIDELYYKS